MCISIVKKDLCVWVCGEKVIHTHMWVFVAVQSAVLDPSFLFSALSYVWLWQVSVGDSDLQLAWVPLLSCLILYWTAMWLISLSSWRLLAPGSSCFRIEGTSVTGSNQEQSCDVLFPRFLIRSVIFCVAQKSVLFLSFSHFFSIFQQMKSLSVSKNFVDHLFQNVFCLCLYALSARTVCSQFLRKG